MKDKNGVEWIDCKHKYSMYDDDDDTKAETYVANVGGREVLIRFFDTVLHSDFPSIYTQNGVSRHITFVEPSETVEDIRAEILNLKEYHLPASAYCCDHDLSTGHNNTVISAMDHIIDRVVKAMEDESNA